MSSEVAKDGPFGLWMGMSPQDFPEAPEPTSAPGKFRILRVPKPHSSFETYVAQISPTRGLSWIKALSRDISVNPYGSELTTAFDSMEKRLEGVYGRSKRMDFLYPDSIWNEPRDWMQSLASNERILMTQWNAETRASLKHELESVALIAAALDASTGYFAVEYSFKNAVDVDAELESIEDEAL